MHRSGILFGLWFFLLLLAVATAAQPGPTLSHSRNRTEGLSRFWRSWYHSAVHLLPTVSVKPSASGETHKDAVDEERLLREVEILARALKREEVELEHLLEDLAEIKRQSWLWFLDRDIREQADQARLKVGPS